MNWAEKRLGEFLQERKQRIKPLEANRMGLMRVHKIDFGGIIHLTEKITNTDMILVSPGDLLISGINVEKGAIAIYQGEEDVLATIHYSSYKYDKTQIDIEYFSWFLKSDIFRSLLVEASGNGIKTELKAKHILPLKIFLPDIEDQKAKLALINRQNSKIQAIRIEISKQEAHLKNLRQAIVLDAVKGKLTQSKSGSASGIDIYNSILKKTEESDGTKVGKRKKQIKPLVESELPYILPSTWVWCKIGEIATIKSGVTLGKSYKGDTTIVPYLRVANVQRGFVSTQNIKKIAVSSDDAVKYLLAKNDLLIVEGGDFDKVGRCAVWDGSIENCIHQNHIFKVNLDDLIDYRWGDIFINSQISRRYFENCSKQTTNLASINKTQLNNLPFAIPPANEQLEIIKKISGLLEDCGKLEEQITNNKQGLDALSRVILKEAFNHKRSIIIDDNKGSENNQPEFRTLILAAEIVWQLHSKQTLGHVKLQKVIFLCERLYRMNLSVNFLKQAMGPYDPKLQRYLDAELEKKAWFKYDETQTQKYQPLVNAGGHKLAFKEQFSEQIESIYHLIKLFENTNSSRIEIVATLFACWEEMILNNQLINDNALLSKFYDWSEFKGNYSAEQVKNALRWMESNSIVPQLPAIIN